MLNRPGRFLSFLLALCLFLTAVPVGTHDTALADDAVYGMTTASGVYVRRSASKSASFWFQLDVNYVCQILGEIDAGGIHWYKVRAVHPNPDSTRTYTGYIHGDYFRPMTATETAEYLAGVQTAAQYGATPTPVPDTSGENTVVSGTGTITSGGTNFRDGASMSAHSIMKLDRGTVVSVTSVPASIDANHWYGVSYAGYNGYVRSDFLTLNGSVTGSSIVTPTPTPTSYTTLGYVTTTKAGVNLRATIAGTVLTRLNRNVTVPYLLEPTNMYGYTWYFVQYNNFRGYLRSDCVKVSSLIPTATPTAIPTGVTPTPTPVPTAVPTSTSAVELGYVMTTKGGVNLRATIAGTVIRQLPKYVTVPYLLAPVQKSGYTWYFVEYDGLRGYLRSDCVKIVSNTPTAQPTTPIDPEASGYLMTTAKNVNLRKEAGYSSIIGRVDKGVTMPYYGEPTTVKGVQWYRVLHPTYGYCYIHGGFVTIVGEPTATPAGWTPTPTPYATPTNTSSSKPEASYTTLKKGNTGEAVKRLVTALKNLGYYTGSITSTYTSAVAAAVKKFQQAYGISVDGVAGAATQHALYGTVPEGSNTLLTIDIYPAEKIDWWSGGINELWAKGSNYKVYDVKTGIVWWAHRWSGGYHVDAEPLTAGDTARLCKCYGVTASSEIASQNLYQRRPLLVTINNRTFCCSLYGVPHNYPEGDTISTNDYKGQLCIHFTNSWTHGSKKVDSLHAEAIQYAYDHAPNGHK